MIPTPEEIKAARVAAGLTQEEAAAKVYLGNRFRWSEYETGKHEPDAARWTLFLLLTGQHPLYRIVKRRK